MEAYIEYYVKLFKLTFQDMKQNPFNIWWG